MTEYINWFKSNWGISGGLISQINAAKILGRTKGRICQMITEGKITGYQFKNESPLISYAEILKMLHEQEKSEFDEIQTEQDAIDYEEHQRKEAQEYYEHLQSLPPEERERQEAIDAVERTRKEAIKAEEKLESLEQNQ